MGDGAMMGRQDEPAQLFYKFSLDRHVPADHILRQIDAALDLSMIRRRLAPYYAAGGRPSIDPELMIRMLLVGYAFAIRSERRLCEEVHLNLAYRWFCRLLAWRAMCRTTPPSPRTGTAVSVRGGEADVVKQHDQHIGRALRRTQRLDGRKLSGRILSVVGRQTDMRLIRNWQNGALNLVLLTHRIDLSCIVRLIFRSPKPPGSWKSEIIVKGPRRTIA